jgi:hypothetical protein
LKKLNVITRLAKGVLEGGAMEASDVVVGNDEA